jgi:hypothetical protein
VEQVIFHIHLLAQLPPYFLQGQLVIRVNEPVEPYHMKFITVLFN